MQTLALNPVELRMHATRKLLPVPSQERINGIADAIKHGVKLPPIYVVAPNLVVAGWTRTLAHRQMQKDIESILITEEETELVALGENTNRQAYPFSYQMAWVYMPLALWLVEHGKKRRIENLKRGTLFSEKSTSGQSGEMGGFDTICDKIGVSRTLFYNVKATYEKFQEWDRSHDPICWGDDPKAKTAMDYATGKILDPENPCTPGQAWAGVGGMTATKGKAKPQTDQLELFCDGLASVGKWGKSFTKFEGEDRRAALDAIKKTVASMPEELREELAREIKRLAKESKEGN